MTNESVSSFLVRIRNERNFTQNKMADAIGIDLRHYQALEYGERKDPGLAVIRKMIAGLGIEPGEILGHPRQQKVPQSNIKLLEALNSLQKEINELESRTPSELIEIWNQLGKESQKVFLQDMKNIAARLLKSKKSKPR